MNLRRTLAAVAAALVAGPACEEPSAPAGGQAQRSPASTVQAPVTSQLNQVTVVEATMAGRRLTAQQAQQLEEHLLENPGDLAARAQLLGHYCGRSDSGRRAAIEKHALWVIENHPESAVAGAVEARIDLILQPEAYEKARKLWHNHCEKQPTNTAILDNAASFFGLHDPAKAIELLQQAQRLEPDNPVWPEKLGHILARQGSSIGESSTEASKEALAAFEQSLANVEGMKRFYMLADVAKAALSAGETEKARTYAQELLDMSVQVGSDWNYGNAVHHGNLILGQIALDEGNIQTAEQHLLQAGRTPGSPQLNSFGPNMALAKALIEAGRRDTVIEYLDLCGKFWRMDAGNLAQWKAEVSKGRVPDFGANMSY